MGVIEAVSPARQQLAVAAVHQREGVVDQAICLAAYRRTLPFDGRQRRCFGVDQRGGDIAWPRAGEAEVEGVQEQDEPRPSLWCELQDAWQRAGGAATKTTIKAPHDLNTQIERGIERQDHGGMTSGMGAMQPQNVIALLIGQDQMTVMTVAAVDDGAAERRQTEGRARVKPLRRRCQDQCAGRDLRTPERRFMTGRNIGIMGERVTPIGGQGRVGRRVRRACLVQSGAVSDDSRSDSLDCGAETPPRSQTDRDGSIVPASLPIAKTMLA